MGSARYRENLNYIASEISVIHDDGVIDRDKNLSILGYSSYLIVSESLQFTTLLRLQNSFYRISRLKQTHFVNCSELMSATTS